MLPGACVVSLLFCDVAQHQQFDVILYFHFQLKLMITVISYRVDKECWTDKKEQKQWFSKDIFFYWYKNLVRSKENFLKNGNKTGLLRTYVNQLLCLSCIDDNKNDDNNINNNNNNDNGAM